MKFVRRGNWRAAKREWLAILGVSQVSSDYERWRELHRITGRERRRMSAQIRAWANPPLISVIVPASGHDLHFLNRQIYPNRDLIVADEGGDNAAIDKARGQYICFLDTGDELPEHSLFRIAEAIARDASIDIIYTDEDSISDSGVHAAPFFKPDWSPEYFLAWPYTGKLTVYRRDLVRQAGGLRDEFESASEYDLMLRLIATGAKVHHIPDILCHRQQNNLASSRDAAKRALLNHLESTGQNAIVEPGPAPGIHRVRFAIRNRPLVSIVIPSACRPITFRDRSSWFVLECVSSIRRLSTYENIEIIILDNNDISPGLSTALAPLDIRLVHFAERFNLTRKINLGASHARGSQLILLNDDVEIITPDWIESMLEFSQQPAIGAVGVQLLFPDDTQQHSGVVILDGNPRHPFYHAPKDHPGYFHSSEVHRNYSAVTGACTMTRTEVFNAAGGYSERFSLSYNDIDYCLKVLELGKRVVYTPYAKLYHHESVSRPLTRPDHVTAFKQYWSSRFPRDPYYNPNLGRHFRIKL